MYNSASIVQSNSLWKMEKSHMEVLNLANKKCSTAVLMWAFCILGTKWPRLVTRLMISNLAWIFGKLVRVRNFYRRCFSPSFKCLWKGLWKSLKTLVFGPSKPLWTPLPHRTTRHKKYWCPHGATLRRNYNSCPCTVMRLGLVKTNWLIGWAHVHSNPFKTNSNRPWEFICVIRSSLRERIGHLPRWIQTYYFKRSIG